MYVAGDTPTEDVLVTTGETTFHGVWVVVVVVVAGLLLNIGATDGLFGLTFGVDTENFSGGEGTAPYVLTLELDVMMTAGGWCWLRSIFFVINLSKKIPFNLLNSSKFFAAFWDKVSPSVLTML